MKNEKKIPFAEKGFGRRQVKIKGKTHHEDSHEQLGADGIIETHVTYTEAEKIYYGKAHSVHCAKCGVWILERHKPRPHGKECR